jgi:hypothetical protein
VGAISHVKLNFYELLGRNFVDLCIHKKDNSGITISMEDANSLVKDTHQFHRNSDTTNSNDSTTLIATLTHGEIVL